MNFPRPILLALAASLLLPPHRVQADIEADLDQAAGLLREGRNYLVGFPRTKTRNELRRLYLGVDTNGEPTEVAGKFVPLQNAIQKAVDIRTDPTRAPFATGDQKKLAQLIAWESLEALLQGQLLAGNGNFLKGLRVGGFPTAVGDGEKPGGETTLPAGCPSPVTGGEYRGAPITDLCYARLHFFRGILAALDFLADDAEGAIRAIDLRNRALPQYTLFNTSPDLYDTAFPTNSSSQTTGYLLGNTLDRYGKAVVAIGDRLWRAAYFDRQRAPGGSRAGERAEMLDAAMREMQQGVHAQFLAALPLAATLEEGELGYEKCRVDQVRVTAATAGTFIDRIRRGEIPKLNDLALASSTTEVQAQMRLVERLKEEAGKKYSLAQTAIWRRKESEIAAIADAQQLRFQFADDLRTATGIDVGGEAEAPFFGLTTQEGRAAFRRDLLDRIDSMSRASAGSSLLADGSDLGKAYLVLRRAFAEIRSAQNRIDGIPQRIRIEEERVGAQNGVMLGTQDKVSAYQLAIGKANSVSVAISAGIQCQGLECGPSFSVTSTYNPGAISSAQLQNQSSYAQTIQQIDIANINAEATIRNLLMEQHQYVLDLESAAAQGQYAVADLNALLARIERLIENHIYVQTSNQSKWYYDPALVFEHEQSEIDYQYALEAYVRELYILSQLLAVRWSEPYENPFLDANGNVLALDRLYDDFTQAESIFNVYKASEVDNFLLALITWDTALRRQRRGGEAEIEANVSIRQDIFGFSDVTYNTNRLRFERLKDPEVELNKRRFRALLLSNAQPQSSRYRLRLEFPLTYNQLSRRFVGPDGTRQPVILASRDDWNIRVQELSARIIGTNVAQSASQSLRVDLVQYGKIEIPRYHPRTSSVYPSFQTFNLPLYYPDPEEASISAFKFALAAGINGAAGVPSPFVAQVEPTPYCDRYVLLIERTANPPVNLENIEDIEITLRCRSSVPPSFGW